MKTGHGLRMAALAVAISVLPALPAAATPLNIGYSDWPGFLPWQIAIDKGWFKEAGVDVNFLWFDYSASMDAFSAGKLDADSVTNGDSLVMGGNGAHNITIFPTDFSSGNDMVIGAPGIHSIKDLKGKKVAVEVGLVDHLLLDAALKKNGMTDKDVALVNTKTNDTPQVLQSGQVSAIAAWQPSAGQAIQQAPGARPIYTSADAPGLIYDGLAVNPTSLAHRADDWAKVVKIWYRCVAYAKDPKTEDDALRIMSARDGLTPATLKPLWKGTHILTLPEAKAAMKTGTTLASVYGSSENADAFNVANNVYKARQKVSEYIDPSILEKQ